MSVLVAVGKLINRASRKRRSMVINRCLEKKERKEREEEKGEKGAQGNFGGRLMLI